ncbi:MAG: hypothetical protein WD875_13050, partial [Pirellulales bacterium]
MTNIRYNLARTKGRNASRRAPQRRNLRLEHLEDRWLLDAANVAALDPLDEASLGITTELAGPREASSFVTNVFDAAPQPAGGPILNTILSGLPPIWEFEGPAPLVNVFGGGHEGLNPNNGAGAAEAIAIHPTDPNIVYVGSVSGGIWKSTNACRVPANPALPCNQTNPQWMPLTDYFDSLSISTITISPLDVDADGKFTGTATGTTVYAGTGSFSNGGLSSGDAIGVLRSTDGVNFSVMKGSEVFENEALKIRGIVASNEQVLEKQLVLVAAADANGKKGGIYRSGGDGTFSRLSGVSSGLPDAPASHIVADLSLNGRATNRVYAAVISNSFQQGVAGIYMSQGGSPLVGSSWTKVDTGIPQRTLDHASRIDLAVSDADGTLYAAVIGDGTGVTCPAVPPPAPLACPAVPPALSVAVAPGDAFMGTVIPVEAPELFRSGDQVQIGFVQPTSLAARAVAPATRVTLADAGIDLQVNDQIDFQGLAGPFTVSTRHAPGDFSFSPALPAGTDLAIGTQVTKRVETAFIIPGGVSIAQSTITIDQLPEAVNNQGFFFPYSPGRIVRLANPSVETRAIMLFQSRDRGANWSRLPMPNVPPAPGGLAEFENITVSTTNGGAIQPPWVLVPPPAPPPPAPTSVTLRAPETGLHPGSQGGINFSMVVSPTNSNLLFIGGDRQPSSDTSGNVAPYGRLFAGLVAPPVVPGQPANVTWDHIVGNRTQADRNGNGVPETATAPHADSRELAIGPDGSILEVDDGGIVRFQPVATIAADLRTNRNLGEWSSIAGNMGTAEFYGIAYDSFQDRIFGGTQDNGSPLQDANMSDTFREAVGGDGTLPGFFAGGANATRYFTSQGFSISRDFLTTAGQAAAPQELTVTDLSVPPNTLAGPRISSNFDFVQVWALNASDGRRILVEHQTPVGSAAAQEGTLYELALNGAMSLVETRSHTRATLGTSGMDLTAAKYGFASLAAGQSRPDLILAGFSNINNPRLPGMLFFRENGNGAPALMTNYRGTGVRDVAIDPMNHQKIVVIDANGQVWRSDPVPVGGMFVNVTFTDITGNLQLLTGGDIRSVEIVNRSLNPFDETILIGGLQGVYQLREHTLTSPIDVLFRLPFEWRKLGLGLPHVLVTDLEYNRADDILVAGTWGRGAWSIRNFSTQNNVFPSGGSDGRPGLSPPAGSPSADGGPAPVGAPDPNVIQVTGKGSTLEITGTPGRDEIVLGPANSNPALLQLVSNGETVATSAPLEITNFTRIIFDGLGGDDHLIVSPDVLFREDETIAIEFKGGAGNNQLSVLVHDFGRGTWDGLRGTVIEADPRGGYVMHLTDVQEFEDLGPMPSPGGGQGDVSCIRGRSATARKETENECLSKGMRQLAEGLGRYFKALEKKTPAVTGVPGAINGITLKQDNTPVPRPTTKRAITQTTGLSSSDILTRLFETGPNAIFFSDIGTEITTTEQLVARLDALGDVVIVQDDADALILDIRIEKILSGDAELAVEALDGAVDLGGAVSISGTAIAKLRIGVDDDGFFLDADASTEPEIVIRNLSITGDIKAVGKVGFLGVKVNGGTLHFDDQVAIEMDIRDPGVDPILGTSDGVVRTHELAFDASSIAAVTLRGNPAADDAVFRVQLSALPLLEGLGPLFDIADAALEIRFADINNPNEAVVTASSAAGQQVIDFLNTDIPQIVESIRQVSGTFQSFTGLDLLATKIPLINKSIGDLLGSVPLPIPLSGPSILAIGETTQSGDQKTFTVDVAGAHLVNQGTAVGNTVKYRAANGSTVEGQVASVGPASVSVRFASVLDQEPDRTNPSVEIFRGGGLGDQLAGLLGQSASTLVHTGTIQGLIEELAQRLGKLSGFDVQVTGSGNDLALAITLPLDLDPITFEESLDLEGSIPGLSLSGAGKFQVQIDPTFNITLGIRVGPGLSPGERIFIVDNAAPEVTLNVTAQLDDPVIRGSLGLLDLTLREQNLGVGVTNDGLKITGTFTVNLNEPVAGDGRITLADLQAGSLTSFVDTTLDARFDIDGLELVPGGALAGALGTLKLSLNGDTAGHVTSLADLTNLPSAITVTGLDEFLNFDNLSAAAIQLVLQQLRGWLDDLRGSSVFATGLPLTGKTLGDVIDVGRGFFDSVVGVLDNPRLVAEGLASVDGRLPQDVSLSLSVNDTIDLNFTVLASQTADNTDLDDLVQDVRAALAFGSQAAGLPNALDVGVRQGALTIFAKTDEIEGLAVSAGDALIGFAKDQLADAIGYRSIDEFFEILAQRLPGPLNPAYDPATNILSFTLAFDQALATGDIPLNFGASLGSLAEISTSSVVNVGASANGSLRVGLNLGNLTGGFTLASGTPLSSINGGQGVAIAADVPTPINDFRVTLRNGTSVDVNLTSSMTTLGDVLAAITNASPFLTATVDPQTQQAIRLVDSSNGTAAFSVAALQGSFAALDLGIVGSDVDGDGVIVGQALHGVSSGDRFFIDPANSTLGGRLNLIAGDVDAAARVGFVDVSIVDGQGTATAAASVSLTDPGVGANNDGRITLDELFDALAGDIGSLVTVTGPTGSAAFDLPITVNPAPLSPPSNTRLVLTASNLFDPATFSAALTPEFDLLEGLENFAFAQLIDGLREVQAALAGVENINLLQQKLPLIDTSLADMLELSARFGRVIDRLEADQPRTIAQFEQSLDAALQAEISGTTLPDLTLTLRGGSFDIDLTFGGGFSQTIPLNFDLVNLGGAADNLISIETGGNLNVSANAAFNLGLTIDVTNPASPQFFVKDTTGFAATASATGTNLSFDATVLVFDLLVRNGTANINGAWTVGLIDDPVDHRYELLSELSTDDFSSSLTGTAAANLPVDFQTVGNPLDPAVPAIVLNANLQTLLSGGSISLVVPDFAGRAAALLGDLRSNLAGLVGSWDGIFMLLDELVDGEVFGVPIPLIGNQLAQAASFLTELRSEVQEAIDGISTQGTAPLLQAFLGVLGPTGLNLLADVNADNVITTADIPLISTPDRVEFDFHLRRNLTLVDSQVAFDLGLPAVGLEIDGGVRTRVGFDFEFGFGFSKTEGVYLNVSKNNELLVNFDATIPNLSATGRLAFLQLNVTDDPTDPSHFSGVFTVDLADPGTQAADGRLSLSELRGASAGDIIDARLTAVADVNLPFVTSISGSDLLPKLRGEFNLDWQFNNADPTGSGGFGNVPGVAFNNLQFDAGSFISDLFGSTLGRIQQVLSPMKPVVDVLSFQIPALNVSLLDLAKRFGNSQVQFIAAVADVANLVQNIPIINSEVFVNLGSFDFAGTDVRGLVNLASAVPHTTVTATPKAELAGMNGQASSFLTQAEQVSGTGFSFPIWDNPSSAFGLFMGKDVDLVLFDMVPLGVNLSKTFEIPIFPPLFAEFTGRASVAADFSFGFDSSGLRAFANSGFSDFAAIADGFFVLDKDGQGKDVDEVTFKAALIGAGSINAAVVKAGIQAGIDAVIALNLDDPNADGRVRFQEIATNSQRGPLAIFDASGQLDVFAGPFLKFGITLPFVGFKTLHEVDLPEFRATLIDFNLDASEVNQPVLGSMRQGELTLHIGPRAGDRQHGNTDDGDEAITVIPGALANQVLVQAFGRQQQFDGVTKIIADGGLGNDTITIAAGVSLPVELSGGVGDDHLTAGIGPATLRGGEGNDTLDGGAAGDHIFGDAGDDRIQGFGGNDVIDGGLGRDTLSGGGGDDTLLGGDGVDAIQGNDGADFIQGGDEGDQISGGAGADTIDGGAGNDSIEGLAGDDVLSGGPGNDTIVAGLGLDMVFGNDGDDQLFGDEDADVLFGGLGNDRLEGGAGDDTLGGDDGNDILIGGAGSDELRGGAGNDLLTAELDATGGSSSSTHVLLGDAGNDTIHGGNGADTIDGGGDADRIFGYGGSDSIHGGLGNDIIDAGAGSDTVFGDDGDDQITAGLGIDFVFGGMGNDSIIAGASAAGSETSGNTLEGNAGNDTITGDLGDDTIDAGDGNDVVFALAGNDAVTLGFGNDTASGGAGNDTLLGNDGDDSLSGGDNDDLLIGGLGNDTLAGNAGLDVLWGDAELVGRTTLLASLVLPGRFAAAEAEHPTGYTPPLITPAVLLDAAGIDLASGANGDGNDLIFGGGDSDWLFGGAGNDRLDGEAGNDFVLGGFGLDVARGGGGDDVVLGGYADDTVHGDDGVDQVYGDDWFDAALAHGSDSIFGDAGTAGSQAGQRLWGGGGSDSLFAFAPTSVLAAEASLIGDEMHGGDGNDALHGNLRRELMFGDGGKDDLRGDSLAGPNYATNNSADTIGANDTMFGGGGEDHLFGGGGNDVLWGGANSDLLEGQDGSDQMFGGSDIDLFILDVNPLYGPQNDAIDGHGGNQAVGDVVDDQATDIVQIIGTANDDEIRLAEFGDGRMEVFFQSSIGGVPLFPAIHFPVAWRGPTGVPLVEQFRIGGLAGSDTIGFTSGQTALDLGDLAARSNDFVGVFDGGDGDDVLLGGGARDRLDGGAGSDMVFG